MYVLALSTTFVMLPLLLLLVSFTPTPILDIICRLSLTTVNLDTHKKCLCHVSYGMKKFGLFILKKKRYQMYQDKPSRGKIHIQY